MDKFRASPNVPVVSFDFELVAYLANILITLPTNKLDETRRVTFLLSASNDW